MPIRLLIADDDPTIRLLLRRLFEHHAGWEVCDECANGNEALEKALKLAPDIVILDLAMPGMNGLQSAQQILRINPQVPILLLSVQQVSRQLAEAARNIGFRGAVTKGNGREVVEGVETLLRGESFFVLTQAEDIFRLNSGISIKVSWGSPDVPSSRIPTEPPSSNAPRFTVTFS